MGNAVKKTISLPPELAKEVETLASEEGKALSAMIQDPSDLPERKESRSTFIRFRIIGVEKQKKKESLLRKILIIN